MTDWSSVAERALDRARRRKRANSQRSADEQAKRAKAIADAHGSSSAPPSSSPPSGPPDGPNWKDQIMRGKDGSILPTTHNARLYLRNHTDFLNCFRWNEITHKVEVIDGPMAKHATETIDQIVAAVQDYLMSVHQIVVGNSRELGKRVVAVARLNKYDPLKGWLKSLQWDGTPRIDTWLADYFSAKETDENRDYLQKVSRRWMIGFMARAISPGCKMDNVLVLESPGGVGKSSALGILGGDFFCDTALALGDKDSRMLASRYWLCELAEMVAFARTSNDTLKGFFSQQSDQYRAPYAEEVGTVPRRCVFVGTTNEHNYLDNFDRRYWIVGPVSYMPDALARLRQDREQLFAEAVHYYMAGEERVRQGLERLPEQIWWFPYEELHITNREVGDRIIENPTAMKVHAWWSGTPTAIRSKAGITSLEAYEMAFGDTGSSKVTIEDLKKVGRALHALGFEKKRDTTAPRHWRFYPTDAAMNAPVVVRNRAGLFSVPGGGKGGEKK